MTTLFYLSILIQSKKFSEESQLSFIFFLLTCDLITYSIGALY